MMPTFLRKKIAHNFFSFSFCMLLFMVAKIEIVWVYNGVVTVIAGILVYIASFDKGYFISDGLMQKLLTYIGERSYSIYLTHLICIVFTRELYVRFYGVLPHQGVLPIYLGFFAFFLIFIMSECSFRYIETPLRIKGRELAMVRSQAY
jgi:peptidoglycan/LPS O-acetylase OafA/YrhL